MQSVLLLVLHGALKRPTGTIDLLLYTEYSADIHSKVLQRKLNPTLYDKSKSMLQ